MKQERLAYRQILYLWFPLALSYVMMSVAMPIVSAGVSRLPDPTINLAAVGLTNDIANLVESPIIMILSTSVSLVRSRQSYLLLRRFVTRMSIALTVLGLLVYFTPLYDLFFLNVLGVSPEVARATQPGLQVMFLWPPSIAWRRLFQGVLISHGKSRLVTFGTVCRLLALASVVVVGMIIGTIPGAVVGGLALVTSVIVEMLVSAWWAMPLIREQILSVPVDPPGAMPLDDGRLIRFYIPLAATDVMRVISKPVTTSAIARMVNATLSLAAWPVSFALANLLSSGVMSIQETTIALVHDKHSQRQLSLFGLGLGLAFTGLLALLVFTPLADIYFGEIQGVPSSVQVLSVPSNWIMVPLPLLFALRNHMRGILIWRRRSIRLQSSMLINLIALVSMLGLGIWIGRIEGVTLAAWATVGAVSAEVLSLWWFSTRVPVAQPSTAPIRAA